MYQEGSLGHSAQGRRLRILDAFTEARQAAANGLLSAEEAMSTSDFATYISKFLRHRFLDRYTEISGSWAQYTRDFSVEDFELYTASRFGRFPDVPQKTLNGPYEQLAIRELAGPSLQLIEWGAGFALTRQLIISDRLDKIKNLPTLLSEALARTVSKRAVSQLEANPTMFDGNALFSAAHANIGTTALTADVAGANLIIAAIDALDTQTDPEGYKIANPTSSYVLIYPRAYRWIVEALQNRDILPVDVTSGTSILRTNQVKGRFTSIEELYLTDANNWYLAIDPRGDNGFLANVTLNGNQTPFLGVRDSQVRALTGADDPYSFDFDEIEYKIRHDFDFVAVEWRSVYGAIVA